MRPWSRREARRPASRASCACRQRFALDGSISFLTCRRSWPNTTRGRPKAEFEQVSAHVQSLSEMPSVYGINENREITQQWLETDIFDLVNRNRPSEAMASLRPLHLDAHKIRVSKHCRDYNHADAVYAMLEYGE